MRKRVEDRHQVAVAPLACLLEDDRPAAAQLGDLPLNWSDQRDKRVCGPSSKVPRRAMGAEDVSRPGRRTRPPASTRPRQYRPRRPCATETRLHGVGVVEQLCDLLEHPHELGDAALAGPARERDVGRLEAQGPGDPIGLARLQRQQEAPRLEVAPPGSGR